MPRSSFTRAADRLRRLLLEARRRAGMTQADVAKSLRRPQSFVSDFERGQRRLDVVEFLEVTRALKADPHDILRKVDRGE
ncbi:MAG TPA: helix-turn-helix transcriptional regulator [Tepidisphaeraceae bacterium]|nr:helix-turn-helix transcriptional regulator [Tepidisphaeraceae bacterium]